MSSTQVHHFLRPFIAQLESGDEAVRLQAIVQLQQDLDDQAAHLPSHVFSGVVSRIYESGLALLNSDHKDRLVGLALLDCLLDVADDATAERRIETANILRKIVENDKQINYDAELLRAAAKSLGHLARVASTTEIEFLQTYAEKHVFKWLNDQRYEVRRFAAVLIVRELAINAPMIIFAKWKSAGVGKHASNILQHLFNVIYDSKVQLREAASEALAANLRLISEREYTDEHLRQSLSQLDVGFSQLTVEKSHGAMLILDVLLTVPPSHELGNTMRNMQRDFQDVCWEVLQRREHRDKSVRQKVLDLIPKMAAFIPKIFLAPNRFTQPNNFLTVSILHLLQLIRQGTDRQLAYYSLGKLFLAMASVLTKFRALIDDIFVVVRQGFSNPFCPEALTCLGMIVRVSEVSRQYVDDQLLDSMFKGGLSATLIETLQTIIEFIPVRKRDVQDRLRMHITKELMDRFVVAEDVAIPVSPRVMNTPNRSGRSAGKFSSIFGSLGRQSILHRIPEQPGKGSDKSWPARLLQTARDWSGDHFENIPDEQLVLALQTLSSFDFINNNQADAIEMMKIVREVVVRYLDDPNDSIRKAAAVTCAVLLDRVMPFSTANCDEMLHLEQVLDRLLLLGVGDDKDDIRASVFESLRPSLDHLISESENVHCLIEALNDESFEVRASAMSVLSRVAHFDTLHVMPLVRQTLVKLMRQLQNSKDTHLKQESVQLLQALVRGTNSLIIPYVRPMLEPLIATLNDSHPAVVGAALSTIGELAVVDPDIVKEHVNHLFPRLIEALQDQSSVTKQQIAVVALGKLVSSLGMVVEPYMSYPGLFRSMVDAIQRSDAAASTLRLEALKTAGLLGALDSYLFTPNAEAADARQDVAEDLDLNDDGNEELSKSAVQGASAPDEREDDELSAIDKYYLSVSVNALIGVLRDPSLAMHHQQASNVVMRIVRVLREQCVSQLGKIVNGLFTALRRSEGGLKEALFDHVAVLIHVVKQHIRTYSPSIVKVINENFSVHLEHCMRVLEALCGALAAQDFHDVLREVLPSLIQVVRDELLQQRDDAGKSNSSAENAQRPLRSTCRILTGVCRMGNHLGEFKRLLIPVLLKILQQVDAHPEPRKQALYTLLYITKSSDDLNEFASRIIHPILNVLIPQELQLHGPALVSLSCLLCRLGPGYVPFIVPARRKTQVLRDVLKDQFKALQQLDDYEDLVSRLLKHRPLPPEPQFESDLRIGQLVSDRALKVPVEPFTLSVEALEKAWALSGRITESDLFEWMRRTSIEVIRQSPSPILRPCAVLAEVYQPIADALFNAAFVSVWDEMYIYETFDVVDDILLIKPLETALGATQLPSSIMHILLNLAEFMDMQDKMIPLDIPVVASSAERAHMLAKSLRYREIEFSSPTVVPSGPCIESLITINNQLGMKDAAAGILQSIRTRHPGIPVSALWLEKLDRHEEALKSYIGTCAEFKIKCINEMPLTQVDWMQSELGKLRCLHALGEYTRLADSSAEMCSMLSMEVDQTPQDIDVWTNEVHCLGAKAAWALGDWERMEDFVRADPSTHKGQGVSLEDDLSYFAAILAIRKGDNDKATELINKLRSSMASSLAFLLGDAYSRAYRGMVAVQVLAEMEEIVELQTYAQSMCRSGLFEHDVNTKTPLSLPAVRSHPDIAKRLTHLREKWSKRLKWAPREVDVWRQLLAVHSLIVDPMEDLEPHLQLATLCRQGGMMSLCENTLRQLGAAIPFPPMATLVSSGEPLPHPRVVYATYKYMWESGDHSHALEELMAFAKRLPEWNRLGGPRLQDSELLNLRVRCLLKGAEWIRQLGDELSSDRLGTVLNAVAQAQKIEPNSYRVWHAWALTNYEMNEATKGTANENPEKANGFVIEAVRGFVKSIALGAGQPVADVLQDTLRLLTVWFSNGRAKNVSEVFDRELGSISPDKWLGVLPQLIARIHMRYPHVKQLLERILGEVADAHPQALVYPITVAMNTSSEQRRQVAAVLLDKMKLQNVELVAEANLVSRELMRVAITSHEQWHEGLEKAAQQYLQEHDLDGMVSTLETLHTDMGDVPESIAGSESRIWDMNEILADRDFILRDVSFQHSYGRDLTEAYEWLMRFKQSKSITDLHQAWDIYHSVFRRIAKQLQTVKTLQLQHIAPSLVRVKNLNLAVPGTYKPAEAIVRIGSFAPSVDVIPSKQRPRRMTVVGSDGHRYRFLLKGHEDLRQDERVMQLFGLINALLANDRSTAKRSLAIQRYSVLPLSNNSGVIGWVEECDTLNSLIKEYREAREIRNNIESKLMLQKSPDYDKLPVLSKVEIFKEVLAETTGCDLAKMLWLKSKTSEVWVERRLNYTKSLAATSMVGYILGLGDRHPSNLMLHRSSGRIVHIDFGDCFEVAMNRSKYPETVPFRLTRMLVNAMEVCGIDGTYRSTSVKVMRVLRENRDSVMAMLEAFVHDPLISWRLLAEDGSTPSYGAGTEANDEDNRSTVAEVGAEIAGLKAAGKVREALEHLNAQEPEIEANETKAGSALGSARAEELNGRAVDIIQRIQTKLTGRDFGDSVLGTDEQVDKLIQQATSVENLCQLFIGWCPYCTPCGGGTFPGVQSAPVCDPSARSEEAPLMQSIRAEDSCQLCRRGRADLRVLPCNHSVHSRCCLFWPMEACPVCAAAAQHVQLVPFHGYVYNGKEHGAPDAPMELRVGAWGPEELKYTYALIESWTKGILPVSKHTKSRNLLTTVLHCLPARLSAKIRLGKADKVVYLQPDALSPKEVMQLRMLAKQTFELEDTFLQQETFKTANPRLTAGLLLLMQQEWQRQLIDMWTERGQQFLHPASQPDTPAPVISAPFPTILIPTVPAVCATGMQGFPLATPALETAQLCALLDGFIPPSPPLRSISSPTTLDKQQRNSEEGVDCFQQIVDVLHNITEVTGRLDAQQYAIDAVTEICCYHQKARSMICNAEGEVVYACHELQCNLSKDSVRRILDTCNVGSNTHWRDGNLLIGETVTRLAGSMCQVRSVHYLGLIFLVLTSSGRSSAHSISSQPGDRSSLRKRKDTSTPMSLSSSETSHRKSLASSSRSSMSYFEDDDFDDESRFSSDDRYRHSADERHRHSTDERYRHSVEERNRRFLNPAVELNSPSSTSSVSLSQHLQRFLDFVPFEAVDLWVPVNAAGSTRLYSAAWAITEPPLIDWIKYSLEFSFALDTPIPGRTYAKRIAETFHDLSSLPIDFCARADGVKRFGIRGCLALPIPMSDGNMLVSVWYSQQPFTAPQEMMAFITGVVQSWKADLRLEYVPSVAPSHHESGPTGLYSDGVQTHVL